MQTEIQSKHFNKPEDMTFQNTEEKSNTSKEDGKDMPFRKSVNSRTVLFSKNEVSNVDSSVNCNMTNMQSPDSFAKQKSMQLHSMRTQFSNFPERPSSTKNISARSNNFNQPLSSKNSQRANLLTQGDSTQ